MLITFCQLIFEDLRLITMTALITWGIKFYAYPWLEKNIMYNVQNWKYHFYFWRVVHIFDASKKTLNYSSIYPRRVENVQDTSPKYIFKCYFGPVMQICDASKITIIIFKNGAIWSILECLLT